MNAKETSEKITETSPVRPVIGLGDSGIETVPGNTALPVGKLPLGDERLRNMPKPTKSYETKFHERLRDPAYAMEYLRAALEDDEEGAEAVFLLALRDVAQANHMTYMLQFQLQESEKRRQLLQIVYLDAVHAAGADPKEVNDSGGMTLVTEIQEGVSARSQLISARAATATMVEQMRDWAEKEPHAKDCASVVPRRRTGMTYYETDTDDERNAPWYFETGPCNCWKSRILALLASSGDLAGAIRAVVVAWVDSGEAFSAGGTTFEDRKSVV